MEHLHLDSSADRVIAVQNQCRISWTISLRVKAQTLKSLKFKVSHPKVCLFADNLTLQKLNENHKNPYLTHQLS